MKAATFKPEKSQQRTGKCNRDRKYAARVSSNQRSDAALPIHERSHFLERRRSCALDDNGLSLCRAKGFIRQREDRLVAYRVPPCPRDDRDATLNGRLIQ